MDFLKEIINGPAAGYLYRLSYPDSVLTLDSKVQWQVQDGGPWIYVWFRDHGCYAIRVDTIYEIARFKEQPAASSVV